MKKLIYLIVLALILGLTLAGCTLLSNIGQVPTSEQSGITYLTKGAETSPDEYELYAGQDILVGNVNVWNDGVELHVTYNTTDGWVLTETHLAVATALGVIPQKNGNPIPGKFPYQCCYDEDEGEWVFQIKEGGALGATCDADENTNATLTEVEYIIPLSGIGVVGVGADDILYIAAHAKVIRPIEDCWETVWQIGDVEVNDGFGQLTNYCDEFNYAGFYEGLGPLYPPFTDPFVVGTTFTNMFPWLSLGSYATDFKVQWFGELLFGGKLTVSWSPGTSATETKIIMSIDDGVPFTFVVNGFDDPSGWLGYPLVQSNLELDPIGGGSHEIRFQHTTGDGAIWDWVLLEKPCVQEESAWAVNGEGPNFIGLLPFLGNNWATYFNYTVQLPQDGMVLWLDAGKGITEGSGVSKWEDQSGNGNHAAQATVSFQPTYIKDVLNDKPVVSFTGGEKYLRHSPILTDSYTAFYVLTLTESDENLVYYYHAGSVNTGDLGFFAETKNKEEGWGSAGNVDTSVTVRTSELYPTPLDWRIHTHQPEALYKDGIEVVYARDDNVYAGGLTDIGSRSDHATLYFVGDIAEILVYDRILTVPEREMVENYLKAKYDL